MNQNMEKPGEPIIELNNISLWRERMLLEGIDWTVFPGQHWVVLGRNGAGKTLLLRILAGYLWPSRGRVRVLCEQFGGVDLRRLRRSIGWVSASLTEQIPKWDTALEVVLSGAYATFGLYREPEEKHCRSAERLMEEMGLGALSGQRFADLSAGEKQRVVLARSRLSEPDLLILDEPCAGLDLAAREKLLGLIERMALDPDGPTMLMVTHRPSEIVPGFTHALLLSQGKMLAHGPLDETLTDDLMTRTLEIPVSMERVLDRWQVRVLRENKG